MDIGPGDFVEAVREDPDFPGMLSVGAIYTIADALRPFGLSTCALCGNDRDVVLLGEVRLPPLHGFCPCAFRPIYRPKQSLIEDLSRPVEHEPA